MATVGRDDNLQTLNIYKENLTLEELASIQRYLKHASSFFSCQKHQESLVSETLYCYTLYFIFK